jgi:hypothetical protein
MEKDLSKPFVKTYREGKWLIVETNLPNDTIGDLAFEYDVDGSQRAKWEQYLKELDEKGTRGQLVYQVWEWLYEERWDGKIEKKTYPLESYSFIILDVTK